MIITRFAPSPTGYLHIGSARTALVNYLFSRKNKGKFILRVEDTDIARSSKELAESIIKGLKWLGINWDEGPFYQSQRFDIYREYAYKLLENGFAYSCFCTKEELELRRSQTGSYMYDKKCSELSEEEIEKNLSDNKKYIIRFNVPQNKEIVFNDKVRGEIKVKTSEIEDFVLLKSDNTPSYHLSVCVDDHLMGITDILRGEDHLTNTFKQILIYKSLDWNIPEYYHMPLILGDDGKKLSKRTSSVDILEYRDMGILPETMVDYLAMLGLSHSDGESISEQIKENNITNPLKIRQSPSKFDIKKILSINNNIIKNMSAYKIYEILISRFKKIKEINDKFGKDYLLRAIELIKSRIYTLNEFTDKTLYLFQEPDKYEEKGIKKYWKEDTEDLLIGLSNEFTNMESFDAESVEKVLRGFGDKKGVSHSKLIHPLRLAVTGCTVSPGIFELCEFLGKEEVIERINNTSAIKNEKNKPQINTDKERLKEQPLREKQ